MHRQIAFRRLHAQDCFVMPNAWDAGSARLLTSLGFQALGTTSAGVAYSLGHPDSDPRLSPDELFAAMARIVQATPLPVSLDLESGLSPTLEGLRAHVARAIDLGAAGASLEDVADYGPPATPSREWTLQPLAQAVARIRAAREVIDRRSPNFVLTARTECFLTSHPAPLPEAITRLRAFAEAGADCVFAPGLNRLEDVQALLTAVPAPLNVLVGGPLSNISIDTWRTMGVRRLSTGSGLARIALGAAYQAAEQMARHGQFEHGREQALSGDWLDAAFGRNISGDGCRAEP